MFATTVYLTRGRIGPSGVPRGDPTGGAEPTVVDRDRPSTRPEGRPGLGSARAAADG